jgi:Na+-transporting NADH:ubiquinone oxidoreductase subunit NqrD
LREKARQLGAPDDRVTMIRFLLRFFGLLCLAAAFILVIYDGTKSIAGSNLVLTSVRTLWELINAGSLAGLKPLITPYADGFLWDPVMVSILAAPAWVLLGAFGIVFILLGRRKKPLIGYARS